MRFEFFPLRFQFVAREPLFFPPGKAANILRGALGIIFRRIACVPECSGILGCPRQKSCLYVRVFDPGAAAGPSGLSIWPRPFVFRARHLDGRTVQPGEIFHFDLHVFSLHPEVLEGFVRAFQELAAEGLGPRRGKAVLREVHRFAAGGFPDEAVVPEHTPPPVSLDLAPAALAPARIRVEFLSPTELKHAGEVVSRPEFPALFGRIRDRISTLRALYGPGPLDIDFRGMGERAGEVRMTHCDFTRHEIVRRSTHTGQTHSLGGFVGSAEYEGSLAEFLPFLEAARWTGVGRQTVWGKGEIAVSPSVAQS